ncbi:UNVERIFIED_CONTAM: hypothetical protein PYX00_003354 [Menopon gallinae]|uniref:Hexamerin n=1 Tax=Menopon gallinae TaxID=328185 RepID=A0AAW2I219_9NEOP
MKIALAFLALAAFAAASVVPPTVNKKVADQDFLHKQKAVLELLWRVNHPVVYPEIVQVATTFNFEEHVEHFTNVEAVKNFVALYKQGLLPQGQVFTILDDQQEKEVVALFSVFYYAKDFETFYKTACWARVNVNVGEFVYAFTAAVIHRPDTQGIVLPAPYEIYPHFFVNSEVIQKAYDAAVHVTTEGQKTVVIPINATGLYPFYNYQGKQQGYPYESEVETYGYNFNDYVENRVNYFTEDVTLNAYNHYYHLDNPVWMNSTFGYHVQHRGEYFYYYHQQILARYLLERLSNDLLDIHPFNFEGPAVFKYGYNPNLRYPNGQYFPVRPNNVQVDVYETNYQAQIVKDYVRRVRDAIDLGYVYTKTGEKYPINNVKGIDYLGHLIQSTVASVNEEYYGELYQVTLQLLGHVFKPHHVNQVAPGVLEHYETVLRDPAYYNILAGITQLFYQYKSHLPHYQYHDLVFPGVKVNSVEVDKLVTFFENFEFDISSVVGVRKPEEDVVVKAVQYRLTHQPFTYKVNVVSDKATTVVVRVFIGPKYDAEGHVLGINEQRKLFVEIDKFPHEVTVGENVIVRNSKDIFTTVGDVTTVRTLHQQVVAAIEGKEQFYYNDVDTHCGFPAHLVLPKGKRGGQTFTFFVAVTPYVVDETTPVEATVVGCGNVYGLTTFDTYPLGYPFDRVIDQTHFFVPNFYQKDVVIFHKKPEEIVNQSI